MPACLTSPNKAIEKSRKELCKNTVRNGAEKVQLIEAANHFEIEFWNGPDQRYQTAGGTDLKC